MSPKPALERLRLASPALPAPRQRLQYPSQVQSAAPLTLAQDWERVSWARVRGEGFHLSRSATCSSLPVGEIRLPISVVDCFGEGGSVGNAFAFVFGHDDG